MKQRKRNTDDIMKEVVVHQIKKGKVLIENVGFGKILLILVLFGFSSCKTYDNQMNKGKYYTELLRYKDAASHYESASKKRKAKPEAYLQLADSYLKLGMYDKYIETLVRLESERTLEPQHYKPYARALMMADQCESAINYFNAYLDAYPSDKIAIDWRKSCERKLAHGGKDIYDRFEVTKMPIEGFTGCYSPVLQGNQLFFSGEAIKADEINPWNDASFTDIYSVKVNEDKIDGNIEPMNKKGLSKKLNVGVLCFDSIAKKVYFSCNQIGASKTAAFDETASSNIGIYSATLGKDGKWTRIEKLSFVKKNHNYMHPTLSKDGTTIYFVSDIPGGYGGMDIYYSKKIANRWSTPVNVGAAVNTKENELFPYMWEDKILYFSSYAHENNGGMDILKSDIGDDGSFGEPENLGPTINSHFDDFGINLNPDGSTGYFSSNRSGEDAIYFLKESPLDFDPNANDSLLADDGSSGKKNGYGSTYTINLYVKSAVDSLPVGNVTVKRNNVIVLKTDERGYIKLELPINGMSNVILNKEGYAPFIVNLRASNAVTNQSAIDLDAFLSPAGGDGMGISDPSTIVLRGIYYDFDKANISQAASNKLNLLVNLMKAHPTLKIELRGHTDARGSGPYNMNLSKKRSEAAVEYVLKRGIEKSRILPKYFGKEQLLNDCKDGVPCTEEQQRMNRRTEVKVIEYDPGEISLTEIKNYLHSDGTTSLKMEKKADPQSTKSTGIIIEGSQTPGQPMISRSESQMSDQVQSSHVGNIEESSDEELQDEDITLKNHQSSKKFFIIGASYTSQEKAKGEQTRLIGLGYYNSEVLHDHVTKRFRISLDAFDTMEEAQDALQHIRNTSKLNDLWILKIKE